MSQSRDQNIEKEYKLGNFVSLRTGKIDFFNTLVVPVGKLHLLSMKTTSCLLFLHDKLFNIFQVL